MFKSVTDINNYKGNLRVFDKLNKSKIKSSNNTSSISFNGKIGLKTCAEHIGDVKGSAFSNVLSAIIPLSIYYKLKNFVTVFNAKVTLDSNYKLIDGVESKGFLLKVSNGLKSLKNKAVKNAVILPILAVLGGTAKAVTNFSSRNESSVVAVAKDFGVGAIMGAAAPVSYISNVGVPAYAATVGSLSYLGNKATGKTSTKTSLIDTIIAFILGLSARKKAKYAKTLEANLQKTVDGLKQADLKTPKWFSGQTTYDEIQDVLLKSEPVSRIINSSQRTDEKIAALIDENIFIAKFLQAKENITSGISLKAATDKISALSKALKEDCPPSRTLEEAQETINGLLGKKYTISKLLGVGTVAESYLATDTSGTEVCIKVIKKGITADKIQRDKEKLIRLITGGIDEAKYDNRMKYFVKNINDLAEGVLGETDLELETKAANEIRKHCKLAEVVKPIEAKPGIYVMERARGISLKTLGDYYEQKAYLKAVNEKLEANPNDFFLKIVKEKIAAKITKIKERAPVFEDFDLSSEQIRKLLYLYMDIINEQFVKIERGGKTVHADIHTGNIFVDLKALQNDKGNTFRSLLDTLRKGKRKIFTLIDTGNFIRVSREDGERALKVNAFIKDGNVEELTNVFLDGAVLPTGLTMEEAHAKIRQDLEKIFFDKETKIDRMTTQYISQLAENLLRKYDIISNNSQLNLKKAKRSANASLWTLIHIFGNKKFITDGNLQESGVNTTEAALMYATYLAKQAKVEFMNILRLGRVKSKYAQPPQKNSEEYLTYLLKHRVLADKDRGANVKL